MKRSVDGSTGEHQTGYYYFDDGVVEARTTGGARIQLEEEGGRKTI